MIIGELNGLHVELGETENGYVYKNTVEFENKSDKICYIPELGIDGDTITDDTAIYKYSDFLDLATDYIRRNCLRNILAETLALELFESVDWQHPSTLLGDWEIHLSETYD